MILYHGTTKTAAEQILRKGFKPDLKYNWRITSKPGFIYLSLAYAPFYAMTAKSRGTKRAIVKVEVKEKDIYPDDDFVMYAKGKPSYSQDELDEIDLETYKHWAMASIEYMGNASAKPQDIKVLGIMVFDIGHLIMVCDPVICPQNYGIMGDYYRRLTEWIYKGNEPVKFQHSMIPSDKDIKRFIELRKNKLLSNKLSSL